MHLEREDGHTVLYFNLATLSVTLSPPTAAVLWVTKCGGERKKGSIFCLIQWKAVLGKCKTPMVKIQFCPKSVLKGYFGACVGWIWGWDSNNSWHLSGAPLSQAQSWVLCMYSFNPDRSPRCFFKKKPDPFNRWENWDAKKVREIYPRAHSHSVWAGAWFAPPGLSATRWHSLIKVNFKKESINLFFLYFNPSFTDSFLKLAVISALRSLSFLIAVICKRASLV